MAIENDLGPPPPEASPDLAAIEYGIGAFVRHVWPSMRPDCSVLWFNEPDVSYHDLGPAGASETLQALDTMLGTLIDWWDVEGQAQGITLLIASDHGQRVVTQPVDVRLALREAGIKVGDIHEAGIDFELIQGGFGQIYTRDGASIAVAAKALQQIDAIELLLSPLPDLPAGVLPAAAALINHKRCPDLIYTFGGTAYAQGTSNRGMHGGASTDEMSAFLAGGGPLLPIEHVFSTPTCTTDLLPTIVSGLALSAPSSCHGRPLTAPDTAAWSTEWVESFDETKRRILCRFRSESRILVDRSIVEPRQDVEGRGQGRTSVPYGLCARFDRDGARRFADGQAI